MSIKKLTEKLDKELTKKWAEYIDLHNELNKHRGKVIEETDMPEVSKLLKEIQIQFEDLYHAFHFINYRYQMAVNATVGYEDFIKTLVKANVLEVPDETTKNNKIELA